MTDRSSARTPLSALLVVLLMTALTAGCSESDDDAADGSTGETDETGETSETSEATEATEATSTTATPTAETTAETTATTGSTESSDSPVPDGSGCTPGDGDTLPDGRWFGYASSWEADSFTFDVACWFSDDEAALAAIEDGEVSPPPDDYHVRNDDELERLLIPAPDAIVEFLGDPADPSSAETVDYPTWVSQAGARPAQPGVWIEISDGLVTTIEEPFVA